MAPPTAPATARPGRQEGPPPSSATAWWQRCSSSPWLSREHSRCCLPACYHGVAAMLGCPAWNCYNAGVLPAGPACTHRITAQSSPCSRLLPPLPVCSGMWMAHTYEEHKASYWRPHGLLNPPENPFLREDLRPRVYSHRRKRELQEQQQQQRGAAAPAMLPAAATAAAAAGPAAAGAACAQRAAG